MVATSTEAARPRGAPPRGERYAALDGLRGLAVLVVVASHLSNTGFLPLPGLAGAGKSGVYLFFVLSAFLLADGLLARPASELRRATTWLDYALRRVLRIWPLYLVVLLLSWGATGAGVHWWHYGIDAGSFMAHATLRAGQSVLWSIPVEFKFYGWLPLIALALVALARRGFSWPGSVSLCALVVLGLYAAWPPAMAEPNDIRLRPYLAIFVIGAFAAYLHRCLPQPSERTRARWGLVGWVALAAFVITVPALWAMLRSAAFDPLVNHRWFVFFGLLWACLLLATLRGPRSLSGLFTNRAMRGIGLISYSVYLWHMPVLDGLKALDVPTGPGGAILAVAGTLAVSALSYRVFERPLQSFRLGQAREATTTGPR